MTVPPIPAYDAALRLARALESAEVPYAIGGAIALGAWSDPRATHDVDINLFVDHDGLERALDALAAVGLSLDRGAARRADQAGDVIVASLDGLRVDLFTPSIPFAWEAMRTRRRLQGPAGAADYLSAEATAVFKLLFFRSKDIVDVERMLLVQQLDLDRSYVRRWLVDMMGEDDERVKAWDAMVAR